MSGTTTAAETTTGTSPAGAELGPDGRRVWRVGTLSYSRGGLANVFLWMLWGDFCLNLMDSGVVPNVIPLQMKKYGASGFQIGLLTGTVMEILATAMVAIISTWSDRHRGRLGRRMPFILWSTPPLAIFLALLGFSPQLADWAKAHVPGGLAGVSHASLTLAMMSVLMVGYKFFDNFPQSVYYYLWPDVIPARVMGTFACWFRVVATLGVLLFNWYLLKYAVDRPGMICLLAAGMYLVSFLGLVVMVREGQYAPPEAKAEPRVDRSARQTKTARGRAGSPRERWGRLGEGFLGPILALLDPILNFLEPVLDPILEYLEPVFAPIRRYVRECYSHPFYWKIYLFNLFFICGFVPFRMFLNIYATDTRHIDLGKLGHAYAIRDIIQMGVFLALGPIVDRIHPIRAGVAANVLTLATGLAAALFVGSGETGFLVWTVAVFASVAIFQASTSALGPRILPQKQYGQFCSANAMVFHIGLMVMMPAAGWVFDRIGYRYIYAWFAAFAVLSSASVILLYFDWKRLGGDEDYMAPGVEEEPVRGFEVVAGAGVTVKEE